MPIWFGTYWLPADHYQTRQTRQYILRKSALRSITDGFGHRTEHDAELGEMVPNDKGIKLITGNAVNPGGENRISFSAALAAEGKKILQGRPFSSLGRFTFFLENVDQLPPLVLAKPLQFLPLSTNAR